MSDTSGRPSGAKGAAEEGDAASTKALRLEIFYTTRLTEKLKPCFSCHKAQCMRAIIELNV